MKRRIVLLHLIVLITCVFAFELVTAHNPVHAVAGRFNGYHIPTKFSDPVAITTGPDGNLWFTETNADKIGRITPSGVITEFGGLTANSRPYGITTGSDGNLWFTEYYGNQIGRITPQGVVTEFRVPTPKCTPYGITSGPDTKIWFTQDAADKIARISIH